MSRTSDIPGLTDYLTQLAGQDDTLARVNRETGELPHGGMQSRPDQGALLTILAKTVGTRTAVEVGTALLIALRDPEPLVRPNASSIGWSSVGATSRP